MALWLDSNSEPQTENEKADLAAIAALKVSTALELKNEGNEYVKKGKKHYKDAIDCYTRAINQKGLGESETSVLFANRAHVNLLLGNNRRALEDAEQAVKLSPTNVKAIYRAAKASFALDMLKEAITYCEQGLELSPDNEDLKKLVKLASGKLAEREKHEAEVAKALRGAKDLLSAFEDRGLKIGKAMFRELTGLKKPVLDKSKILHWPVVLLYPEVGSSVCLSKTRILHYLLEGSPGAGAVSIDEEKDSSNYESPTGKGPSRWVKVNEKRTLHDVLKEPNLVIPGIPVFYIVSKSSTFYNKFKSGKWALPQVPGEDTA
uniref:Uncharacterized protein n=1 Tax=Chenopodium quinoa TaxID=63459 RepID=A0A803LAD2_CHEQI